MCMCIVQRACNLEGCLTIASIIIASRGSARHWCQHPAVKANLIISFPFFTFIPKLNLSSSLTDLYKRDAPKHKIENEFTPIHMTATDKRSLQISLPQIFSVSQSKFTISILVIGAQFNCIVYAFIASNRRECRMAYHLKGKRATEQHRTLVIG